MEERIIEDEGRTIKVKKNAVGGIEDAVDSTAPAAPAGGAAEGDTAAQDDEVEFAVDYPDEEYDDDMVGLTPTQLKKAQEERERAREKAEKERDKLIAEGKKALAAKSYTAAEGFFSQALVYDEESVEAQKGAWESRTHGFSDDSAFYIPENAERLAGAPEEVRSFVLSKVGDRLKEERAGVLEEMRPLKAAVREARQARRGALEDNKRYYVLRTAVFGGAFVLFLALVGVFSAFLLRTPDNWPVICMAVSGGLALIALIVFLVYLRGLVFAVRLVADNERDEGTEDGRRLTALENELECLTLVLGDEEEEGRVLDES